MIQFPFLEDAKELHLPLCGQAFSEMVAGDFIRLTGPLYTGRDQTHRLLCQLLDEGKTLPVDLSDQLLYYVGPSPARPGQVIGAAGPTTSYRMDAYTPRLLSLGLKATMGKGSRSLEVRRAMLEAGAVYLATFGGAGALLSQCIRKSEVVAFAEAGPEALFRFEIENFPAVVINDLAGRDYYEIVKQAKGG